MFKFLMEAFSKDVPQVRVRVGRDYLTREGKVTTIVGNREKVDEDYMRGYRYRDGNVNLYREDGRYFTRKADGDVEDSPFDLVRRLA